MSNKTLLLTTTGKVIETYIKELVIPLKYQVLVAKDYETVKMHLTQTPSIDVAAVCLDIGENVEPIVDELLTRYIPTIPLCGCEDKEICEMITKKDVLSHIDKDEREGLSELAEIIQKLEKNSTKKVLVVDDSAMFRQHMVDLLRRHRFITLEASDGEEALSVLQKNPDIKLVISDYEMPKLNGLELVRKVRERYKLDQLPIIIVSSIGKSSVNVACLNQGANDYLNKPFEREEFFSRVYLALLNQENIDALSKQKLLLEEYQKILNTTTVITRTNAYGIIIDVSDAMCELSGYSREELLGQTHALIRHPDTDNDVYEELWETILSGNIWTGELKNKKKSGDIYWVQTTITPEKNSDGTLIGFNAVSHDNTMKKELETLSHTLEQKVAEEINKNKQQASHMLQQSRLAQMGEMISMIAHQWRQPLASISAISGTLTIDVMMDNYKKEFFQERLDSITELSQHLSSTINDFRSFFKDKKEKETIHLNEIVFAGLQIIGPTLDSKNIVIDTDITKDIALTTYPNEIKQVLLNLLKNAEEALNENNIKNGKIKIHGYEENDMAHLKVEDNAGGIPHDIIDNVFDPYFSTKIKKDGTGLGLYMSKTIIEEHCQGHIRVENISQGACFTLSLPLKLSKVASHE